METTDLGLDTNDTNEHDPFGGATPVGEDQDMSWTPQRPARRPSLFWIGTAVVAIALGTGAFVGMRSAANNTTTTTPAAGAFQNGPGQGPGQGGGPPGFQQGDGAFGLLQSVNGSTLTLQTPDGQTVKVTTTPSTQITKVVNGSVQSASLSQLTTGQPVIAQGTTGSDGTVAATSIRQGGGPRGGGGGGPGFGPPPDQQPQQQPQQQTGTLQ
jgi:hypothetical protein